MLYVNLAGKWACTHAQKRMQQCSREAERIHHFAHIVFLNDDASRVVPQGYAHPPHASRPPKASSPKEGAMWQSLRKWGKKRNFAADMGMRDI